MAKYFPPTYNAQAFHCPMCGVYARQRWAKNMVGTGANHLQVQDGAIAQCEQCNQFTIWLHETMIYPDNGQAPQPVEGMPPEVLLDFVEAASIATKSPRAAAALLRLSIQKLCIALGQPGRDLNKDIGALVKEGLPIRVQQALDYVRVIGNNAVHPGEINIDDNPEVVSYLFDLVNYIVEQTITRPKEIEARFGGLPDGAKAAVARRDAGH